MQEKRTCKTLVLTTGTAITAMLAQIARTDINPFAVTEMSRGYMQLAEGSCGEKTKSEGSCGTCRLSFPCPSNPENVGAKRLKPRIFSFFAISLMPSDSSISSLWYSSSWETWVSRPALTQQPDWRTRRTKSIKHRTVSSSLGWGWSTKSMKSGGLTSLAFSPNIACFHQLTIGRLS